MQERASVHSGKPHPRLETHLKCIMDPRTLGGCEDGCQKLRNGRCAADDLPLQPPEMSRASRRPWPSGPRRLLMLSRCWPPAARRNVSAAAWGHRPPCRGAAGAGLTRRRPSRCSCPRGRSCAVLLLARFRLGSRAVLAWPNPAAAHARILANPRVRGVVVSEETRPALTRASAHHGLRCSP